MRVLLLVNSTLNHRYDEAGLPRRIQCLQYLLLANMLSSSDVETQQTVNLFEANEVKPYVKHPQIIAMKTLVENHQQNHVQEFERTLKENEEALLSSDSFLRDHIRSLLNSIRYVSCCLITKCLVANIPITNKKE